MVLSPRRELRVHQEWSRSLQYGSQTCTDEAPPHTHHGSLQARSARPAEPRPGRSGALTGTDQPDPRRPATARPPWKELGMNLLGTCPGAVPRGPRIRSQPQGGRQPREEFPGSTRRPAQRESRDRCPWRAVRSVGWGGGPTKTLLPCPLQHRLASREASSCLPTTEGSCALGWGPSFGDPAPCAAAAACGDGDAQALSAQ